MGVRVNTGSGIDPNLVNKLIEAERIPIKQVESRKDKLVEEQKSFKDFSGLVSALGSSLNSVRNRTDFIKLKLESSHPDIIDGTVDAQAVPGSYELEVRHTAKTHKLLAAAFPDKDKTPVGFGYMSIELDDGRVFDVDISPDASTLSDVARAINDANAGAKAIVINTKEGLEKPGEESYRLLVISEKSGKEAKVFIDPDTTYLEFKEQVTGRNLELLFEDVPVFDEDNTVEELMPGLTLSVKRAEPGTKINVKIDYDVDKTMESISGFVEAFNKVNDFVDKQFQIDPQTNKAGPLSKDNTLRNLRRSLQNAVAYQGMGKFKNLADVGITTDPKTGALKLDDTKAKKALSEDYLGVAQLFTQGPDGLGGFGTNMSDSVRNLQNQQSGILPSKDREYKRLIDNIDNDLVRRERAAASKADGIKRRFASLEQFMNGMNAQGQAIAQRLGVPQGPMPGLS